MNRNTTPPRRLHPGASLRQVNLGARGNAGRRETAASSGQREAQREADAGLLWLGRVEGAAQGGHC